MKRILCLIFALCLLLCGCGGGGEETTPSTTEATVPMQTTGAPTEAPTTVPETTEAIVLYTHPLNGEQLEEPFAGRATAVVINNIQAALPQYGTSQADMIYELETEGGITRLLAVFSDLENVGSIGPVRSARTFFNNIALSHDAVLIHCGGSQFALNGNYSDNGDVISNWEHINEQSNGAYFFRDTTRYNSGYAWEHTLFTSGQRVMEGLQEKGYRTTPESTEGYDHGLVFAEQPDLSEGETATSVTVKFRNNKTTSFQYDVATGTYKAYQYDKEMMDAGAGKQLTFRNVIVIYTKHFFRSDAYYSRSFYELSGSGEGHFVCDGKIVPIQWHRDELRGSISYTYADGTPVEIGMGKTYVAVVDIERGTTTYQ